MLLFTYYCCYSDHSFQYYMMQLILFCHFVGLFTFDEELKQTSHYQVKSSDITPFGLSSDDDDDFSTDGKVMGYQNLTVFI